MASANWMKVKGAGEAKAIMRHCDQEEREKHDHANKDINKALTAGNWSMNGLTYEQVCKEYDKRIQMLDNQPGNVNKRKDRVTYVSLDVPVPAELPKGQMKDWFARTWEIFQSQTGNAGIEGWVHVDEVHDYVKDGQIITSREHMHIGAVPQVAGRLCAKEFMSRKNINRLNRAIQDMSLKEFGIAWNDGSKRKSTESVEELKGKSLKEMEAWERSLQEREQAVSEREQDVESATQANWEFAASLDARAHEQDSYQAQLAESASRLKTAAESVEIARNESKQNVVESWIDSLRLPRFVRNRMKDSYQVHETEQASAEARQQNEANRAAREAAEAQALLDEIEAERKAEREKREREAEAYRKEMERLERNAALRRQKTAEAAKKAEYDSLIAMGRKWRQEGAERVQQAAGRRIPEPPVQNEPEQQELGG